MTSLDEMVLVPRPRRATPTGRGPRIVGLRVRERITRSVPPEGFRLSSLDDGVRIEHRDAAGLRYAHQLLAQVVAQSEDGRLPGFVVEDSPDIPVRGLMLDISRDRVPTRPTLERIVELASLARLNQLQLYVEHTFTYSGHREVWQDASPMTPAHISWLQLHCAHHGIELVAHQSCFGHMGRWLRHDAYRPRSECPDGWEPSPGTTLPPATLAPTEDNAAFALDLLDELLPCFRSSRVHIGGDEPFELGRGASRTRVDAEGLGPVYVEHIRRLADPLLDRGYEVQIWADVLVDHPHLAAALPDGIVPIAWTYEAPTANGEPVRVPDRVQTLLDGLGISTSSFSGFALATAALAEAEVPFWVAPGTSSWSSLVGRIDNAKANLVDAAETARAHDCGGYLITDWGDGGHHQPPSVSFGPLVYGGAVAWGLDANRDLDLAAVLDHHVFADPTGCISSALESLGREWRRTGRRAINASPLAAALLPHQPHLVMGRPDVDALHDVVDRIDAARAALDTATPDCTDADVVVFELRHAARMARHGARRLLGPAGPSAAEMTDDMGRIIEDQVVSWLARSRPGGLSDSLAELDRTVAPTH